MLTQIVIKILSLFMPIVLAFGNLSVNIPLFADNAQINYAFVNSEAGSAAGADVSADELAGALALLPQAVRETRIAAESSRDKTFFTICFFLHRGI